MNNNYDSVEACITAASTHSQKQEGTSYTATKRNWLSFVTVFIALFCFSIAQGQTYMSESFEGTWYLNGNNSTAATPAGPNAPSGWTQSRPVNDVAPASACATSGGKDWGKMAWSGTAYASVLNTGLGTSACTPYSTASAPTDGSNILWFNDGYCSSGNTRRIVSPFVDLSTSSSPLMSFSYSYAGTGVVSLVGSLDGGTTWNNLSTISATSSGTWVTKLVVIPAAYKISTAKFGFQVASTYGSYDVFIDKVVVREALVPAAPITFTTTAVTSAGMTVNWVDNSTNEVAFKVYRSTDNVTFTQVGSDIASTTGPGTGTVISQIQTGLLPNTTYYYRISSVFEAESSYLTGTQSTNAPGTFVSIASGNYGTATTWDINAVPTLYDSVTISTGNTVTIDAASQAANNVIVNGTLTYGTTPTSFAIYGNLTVNTGGVVNVFNTTTGKTLTVAGNISNNGTLDFSVGGSATSSTGSSLLTLNGASAQTISGSGTFLNNKIGSLTCSNTSTATPNIVWQFDNLVIQHNLNLSGARFDLGALTLSHGSSFNTNTGSISLTTTAGSGFMPGAKYRRWFTTGATGSTITAATDPTSTSSRFPFVNATGTNQRWVHIQRSSSTTAGNTAGYLAVKYVDATTTTNSLSISDGAYTITDRYDAKWTVTAESGYVYASGTHSISIGANNAFFPSNGNTRLMLAAAALGGTHQNGTITPGAQRTALTTAQLTAGDIYLGINAADIPFISVANGDWETASTWNKNAVPTTTDVVYIANGTTVAVNATAAVSNAMTIYAGGTLNMAGSTLGVTTSLTNNGTLNVSGGTMSTTTTVANNASSTITISGTGTLSVGSTLTNSGTINANAGNLTVTGGSATGVTNSSTGTFVIAGGAVRLGPVGGGNTSFSNSGILTVSSGTLNINGSYIGNSGCTLNQSGGDINLDGNAAGVTANSVASGTHLFNHTAAAVTNLNLTAGRITIVDPHANTSNSDYSLRISQGGAYNSASANHTFRFGDGVSNDNGGNTTYGFYYYLYPGSYYYGLGNLEINAGTTGANRWVYNGTTYLNGNINIVSGELRQSGSSITCPGNITNNGIFTNGTTLTLGLYNGTATNASTNAQTISGTGVFRNLTTAVTANLTALTVNNSNATGVTLSVPLSVSGSLTMTSGIINTTNTNLLTLGTATAAGTLSGTPSATNMVKGPFARTIATANANTNYVLFPVGKSTYAPISIAPTTTAVTVMKAETFDSNSGTVNPAIVNMSSTKRWEAPIVSGTVTDLHVRLGDAGILATSIPVQAPSASGQYTNTFGSVATAVAGATTQSNTVVTGANYTGFLSYANSNACSGTPAPGNTVATSSVICLGTSVTLSLQNTTSGTGVTYQWKSSTDGVTYTAVDGATNATLTVTPTSAIYYLCDVTCSAGPATGTSTAVQITFTNSITATTAGTRCGTGTVVIGATANTGSTVKWYSAVSGGSAIGSGDSFTTPSIAATTTYYAGAESATTGSAQFGTGTTTSGTNLSAFNNYRASAKYQMIYTASEIAAAGLVAGDITSIAYNVTSLGSSATNANYTVKIGSTTMSTFTGTTFAAPTFTTCYGPSTYTHTASGSQTINFTTPYVWDGTSNIIIEVSHDGIDASASANTLYTATTGNTVLYSYNGANNTLSTNRFNVLFTGQVGCQSARVPVVATVTSPPALTVSAATATICESDNTSLVSLTSLPTDYNTYVWSPSTGVTGNETTGWVFNPSISTNYTLTAVQTSGNLCSTTTAYAVTVNPRPSVLSIAPTSASICPDTIQSLEISGGTTTGVSGKVGTGTATNTISTPFKGYYGGSKSQALYTAAELTSLGMTAGQKISSIGFVAVSGTPLVLNGFTINAGFVSTTTLGTTFISGASNVVFAPVNYTPSTGTGNLDFALTSPLTWDGVSNLLVETCFNNNNGGGSSSNSISVESSTVASGLNLYNSLDNTADVCSNLTAPSSSTNRPNLRITTLQPSVITWSPISNLYTDAAASIAYTANANASKVYFKSSTPAPAVTYTATATTGLGCFRSATVDVTVNPLPTVATVAPAAVCSGSTVDLTASAVTTGSDTGLTYTYWTNAGATTALTNSTAVATSGTYYIKGTNANGCSSVASVVVTVNPLPTVTTLAPATVCYPSTVDLTASAVTTGSDSGLTYTYFTDLATTTSYATPTAAVAGTYYIKGTNANGCSSIASVVVSVNQPAAPTGSTTADFCGTANMTNLSAVGSGIKWYDAATAGNQIPVLSVIGLTTGTTYYASQTVAGCESVNRLPVAVTIIAIPSAPNASSQTFCNSGTVADLAPSGSGLQWYDVATNGTALTSATPLATGTYFVSQTSFMCEGPRTSVSVTVNTTGLPTASAQTFCASATVADLVATGTAIKWYAAATGGSALASTATLSTTNYYASQTINGCEGSRIQVPVTVNTTAVPSASAQTFCTSATVADLVATGAGLQWYVASNGGSALASTASIATGTYYVSQTLNTCESLRLPVNVTITTASTPTGASPQAIFGGVAADATIEDISVSGTNVIWYPTALDAAAGTNAIVAGTQITNGSTYYAVSVVGSCRSNALAVTVTVTLDRGTFDVANFSYYPNPTSDVVNISYADEITRVRVFNMLGQEVITKQVNATTAQIDLSQFASGTYFVEVTSDEVSKTVKVIKK